MIANKLLDIVLSDYVRDGERLVGHKFVRQLNRCNQTYYFFLIIVVESKTSGLRTDRFIFLGSTMR